MDNPILYLFVATIVCFIGTIPFGPINLSVVKTTIDYDRRRGFEVALAASLIEIIEALIAIFFGMLISRYLESNPGFRLLLAFIFIGLAGFVLMRETRPVLLDSNENERRSFFTRGLLLAALNPQAIPFWVFALAAISQYFSFDYVGISLLSFLLGVFVGKFAALTSFVVASDYLKAHLQDSSRLVNRLLAAILLLIGISQAWGAF